MAVPPPMYKPYRLGLDLGTNSIGFALVNLGKEARGDEGPYDIIHIGVRIFSDGRNPKDGTSLAVDRRMARGMRRRRDRLVRRRQQVMEALIAHGLMPQDKEKRRELERLDPYELRKRGLDEKLEPYALGRALFHLNQRRGFQSNRKQTAKDKESGIIYDASAKLAVSLRDSASRTYGEFLFSMTEKKACNEQHLLPPRRIRNKAPDATKILYDFILCAR